MKRIRWQVYEDFYTRKLKIKRMYVCAEPMWRTYGSLFKCIRYWLKHK